MSGEGQPTAELFCGVANLMKGSQRNQAAIGITEIKRGGQRPPKRRSTHLAQDRCCSYEGNGVCLEAALLCEARLDRRDVSFAITQRVGRRVDRVVAKDKIVFVRSGRAENELSIGQRFEFDRFA
jgi:hypothetical protein